MTVGEEKDQENRRRDRRELEDALAGDETLLRRLIDRLTAVVQARVARRLMASALPIEVLRERVADLTQDIFVVLFADDARMLRGWDPQRGLSLENFVGLITEQRVAAFSRRHGAWLPLSEEKEETDRAAGPEKRTLNRERLRKLLLRFRERLSPLGWHLFDLLYLRELSVEETVRITNLSADAVYAWRSRLWRLAREIDEGYGS